MILRQLHRALATSTLPSAAANALLILIGQPLHSPLQRALDEVTP